jgi:hypothetical protein
LGPQLPPGPQTCGEQETPWQPAAEFSATAPSTAGGVYTATRSKRRRAASIFSSWSSAMAPFGAANLADNHAVLGGMLPTMEALFTLVRDLSAARQPTSCVPQNLVRLHGLAPMAARAGAHGFRDDLVCSTIAWAATEQEVPALVRALRAANVRVAPLKGLLYARWLYPWPAERPMADVDLLVQPLQVGAARRALRALGFAPAFAALGHHAEPWTRGDFVLDLHWNIIAPGRSRIDLERVWSRTRPGWPEGAESLEATDALVFHLVHLARNRLRLPLVNVVDGARLLELADRDTALERAASWGLKRAANHALRFIDAILHGMTGDRPGGWPGPTWAELAVLSRPGPLAKVLFDTVTAGSWRQLAARSWQYSANQLRNLRNHQTWGP